MRLASRFVRALPALLLILLLFPAVPAQAAAGSLDTTFDTDGKVTTDFGGTSDVAHAVAVLPDGRIVTAGYSLIGLHDFALARYNPDGSLDTTFDTDGRVTTNFFGGTDLAFAVAAQSDGRIVAAGQAITDEGREFALARYNVDGSLDTTFGGDGKVITAFGVFPTRDLAQAVAVQPDGKIVAAGYANNGALFALARYNPDGSLDTTFDTDGRATTTFSEGPGNAHALAVQPDGRIVAAGLIFTGGALFAVARYNPDGSLDNTFDTDGRVTTAFSGGEDAAYSVALQPDGRIVVGGQSDDTQKDFALARYNTDGSLDATFSGDGKLTTRIGSSAVVRGIALQPDGRIVAGGHAVETSLQFGLARYKPDGTLDTSFDTDGKVTTTFSGVEEAIYAVALEPDGNIVAAGYSNTGSSFDFAVAQYDWTTCTQTGTSLTGTKGPDVLCGTSGNDSLTGLGGDDILIGGGGNDALAGGKGNDALLGGTGTDTAMFQDSGVAGSVVADLQLGQSSNAILGTDTLLRVGPLSTIENVTAGPGGDILVGDAGPNVLNGKAGGDELMGGDANDTLLGGSGEDVLAGQAGNDQIQPGPGADLADGGPGLDALRHGDVLNGVRVTLIGDEQTSSEDPEIAGFESLFGSPFADILIAQLDRTPSVVIGGGDEDTLDTADGDALDLIFDNLGAGQTCSGDAGDSVTCS